VNIDAVNIDGVQILSAAAHTNKLRLGHLRGNRFFIVLAPADGQTSAEELAGLLSSAAAALPDVPNLFGQQRFGREQRTLDEAARFVARGRRATTRRERFWVSAVQSALFNGWLCDRVLDQMLDCRNLLLRIGSKILGTHLAMIRLDKHGA
jgi:tRNA pseudouridine13 synthase